MLLTKQVEIKCVPQNMKHYATKGYSVENKKVIDVNVNDLPLHSRVLVEISCDYCGDSFKRKYTDHNRYKTKINTKDSCGGCKGRKMIESNQKLYSVNSTSQIKSIKEKQTQTFKQLHGWNWHKAKEIIEGYGYSFLSNERKLDAYTKIEVICPSGHSFSTDMHHFENHGNRCPKCAGNIKKTTEEFKDEVYVLFKDEYTVIGEYMGAHNKIKMKHNGCGHEYSITPVSVIFDMQECPYCSKGTSKSERVSIRYLDKVNIHYVKEKSYSNLVSEMNRRLRFDFFILDKVLFELDGQQHFYSVDFGFESDSIQGLLNFEKVKLHDKIKNQYCIDNNIPLLRIPYWEFDNIESILESTLMHFNIIERSDACDVNKFKQYLVDKDWDHDEYISKCLKK